MSGPPRSGPQRYLDRLFAEAVLSQRPLCLDSGPLIDFIAGQQPVAALLASGLRDPNVPKVISTVTLAEVVGRPASRGDQRRVRAIFQALAALPGATIVALDLDHALESALVRAQTNLKPPDAAIVATARRVGAGALLGNDRQWRARPLGVPYHHMDDILALP
jgi:predicted nucleic acid-binding protein